MLQRLVSGITGAFDDLLHDETPSASESGSPPRVGHLHQPQPQQPAPLAPEDSGHLTLGGGSSLAAAGAEAGPSSRPRSATAHDPLGSISSDQLEAGSAAGPSSQQQQQDGGGGGGGWGGILGGAPLLPGVSFLSSLLSRGNTVEEDEEGDEEAAAARRDAQVAAARAQEAARGGSASYPGLSTDAAAAKAVAEAEAFKRGTTPSAPLQVPAGAKPPPLSHPSALLSDQAAAALAAAVPARYRQARWSLLYSTARDGISMQTMLRNARGMAPTVLVVRDLARHIFGAYASEPWRLERRYFGTGESFVFRLEPGPPEAWFWWWRRMSLERNDFFQWGAQEGIAVGGAGGYALWLDTDLCRGLSRPCLTFGNSCLASAEEFEVGTVELWGLA